MTAEVLRHLGGPGTGKTHTLLEYIRAERDDGLALEDLIFCSFTRSQRDEVRSRIRSIFPDANATDIRKQVKTVHGVALTDCLRCGLIPPIAPGENPIITEGASPKPFAAFCHRQGLAYQPRLSIPEPGEEQRECDGMPAGNLIFSLSRYIRQQYSWTPEHWMAAMRAKGMTEMPGLADVPGTIRAWEAFKAGHQLFEHDDYVDLAIRKQALPAARVMVIDEFQDLTPAQYRLFCSWCASPVERIYIAGDPNQTIYGFRGADPVFLTRTAATDRDERPVSHRCPAEIMRVADTILGAPSYMQPKGSGGLVATFCPDRPDQLTRSVLRLCHRYGRVLVLSRFRHYVGRLARLLSAGGLPVTGLSPGRVYGWEDVRTKEGRIKVRVPVILRILRALDDYHRDATFWTVPPADVAVLVQASTLPEARKRTLLTNLKVTGSLFIGDLPELLGIRTGSISRPAVLVAASLDFTLRQRRNLIRALDNRIAPGTIRVDTIHAAKGLEAPAVVLHTGYLPSRLKGYFGQSAEEQRREAEERRVYYVGATRASEALFFLDGFGGTPAPPLEHVM